MQYLDPAVLDPNTGGAPIPAAPAPVDPYADLGVPPPVLAGYPSEPAFNPSTRDRILESIYNGLSGMDLAAPHGGTESFLSGLTGSLQSQGAKVAGARQKFEAGQERRRLLVDEQRRKATEDYNKRIADARTEVAKERRQPAIKGAEAAATEAATTVPMTSVLARRYPDLGSAFPVGSNVPLRVMNQYTSETPAQKATQAVTDESVMTPRALKARVSIFRAGGPEPTFGMGKAGVANRVAFNEELAKQLEAEGQTGADVMAGRTTQVAERANLTQLTKNLGMVKQQQGTLHDNSNLMLGLAEKIPDTGIPLLNAIVRPGAEKVMGSPDVARFHTALGVVQPEAARILTAGPSGGGQLSDSARKELQTLISGNFTKAQLRGAIATIRQDADNRVKNQQAEIDATKGRLSQIGIVQPRNKVAPPLSDEQARAEYEAYQRGRR